MATVDFDGRPDLIISSFLSDVGGEDAGQAFVFSGATGDVLRTITFELAGDQFGYSTVGVGDVNGDEALDFMVSADLHDAGGATPAACT